MFTDIKKIYQPIFTKDYATLLFYGGRGSGKSYGVTDSLIHLGRSEKLKILTCRETKQSMEKSVVALYKERINHYDYKDFICQKEFIKNTYSGSEYFFLGLNDSQESFIQGIKSIPNIDIVVIEEAQSISKRALDILIPTLRRNHKGSKLIAVWNPNSKQDAIWDLVKNPRERTYIQKVNYLENTFCPPEAKEEAEFCKVNKPEDYQHIWLGEPLDYAGNTVTKYFSQDNIKEVNYINDIDLHICCDFNVDPMSWALAHKTDDKIFFFDEIVIENTTTYACVEEFYSRYPNHKGNIIINGDASGDNRSVNSEYTNYVIMKNRLQQLGYKVEYKIRPGNPSIKSRIAAWNAKILSNKGIREILISPKCKWILYNIENLKYKEGTSLLDLPSHHQIKGDKRAKFLGHIFDAISYPVEYYWRVSMEYPAAEKRPLTIQEQFKQHR